MTLGVASYRYPYAGQYRRQFIDNCIPPTIYQLEGQTMKLYATTRSERAEKGQGGNSYVATTYTIEHDTKEREVVATTSVSREGDTFVVRHVPVQGDETVHHVPIRKV